MLAGLAAFAVYASLSPRVAGPGDASEFVLVLARGGVAHPTGYPLYTLAGHAFCVALHAAGMGWARAANLWSAAGGAVAAALLHAAASRRIGASEGASATARFLAALLPVALFACQPLMLAESTSAEVNSWSAAWACGIAYAFVRMLDAIAAGASEGRARRGALVWGLVCGAGLAHHLTSILVSASLSVGLLLALRRERRQLARLLAGAAGAAAAMVASYAFVAWRAWHPAVVQWPALQPSLASVLDHVTGEQYRHFIGYFAPVPEQRTLLERIVFPFLAVGLALLVAGAARARDRTRRLQDGFLALAALASAAFTLRYGVPDPAAYFLPPMALGMLGVAPVLLALAVPRARGAALRLGVACLATLALIVPWARAQRKANSTYVMDEVMMRSMWSAIPDDSAIVFWHDDRYIHLRGYQVLDGEKPALTVLSPELLLEPGTRASFRARFGFDPAEGFRAPRVRPGSPEEPGIIRQGIRRLMAGVNERTRVPVIVFDPTVPIVQQLRKPWEPLPGAAASGKHP